MSAELLQQAIQGLKINDVFVCQSSSSLVEGFDPQFSPEAQQMQAYWRHQLLRTERAELIGPDSQLIKRLFRVVVSVGVVLATLPADSPAELPASPPDETVKARIEAVFVAEYEQVQEVAESALEQFALQNASFHVWPYWREYLASQCQRMNLPKLILPTTQFAKPAGSTESSSTPPT